MTLEAKMSHRVGALLTGTVPHRGRGIAHTLPYYLRPNPHWTRRHSCKQMEPAEHSQHCEWECSHWMQATSGAIHTGRGTRRARKFECFSFDVACVQCGHHSHQQVLLACVASRVLCGLGPKELPVWIGAPITYLYTE